MGGIINSSSPRNRNAVTAVRCAIIALPLSNSNRLQPTPSRLSSPSQASATARWRAASVTASTAWCRPRQAPRPAPRHSGVHHTCIMPWGNGPSSRPPPGTPPLKWGFPTHLYLPAPFLYLHPVPPLYASSISYRCSAPLTRGRLLKSPPPHPTFIHPPLHSGAAARSATTCVSPMTTEGATSCLGVR